MTIAEEKTHASWLLCRTNKSKNFTTLPAVTSTVAVE
jgi:hypothetical protein